MLVKVPLNVLKKKQRHYYSGKKKRHTLKSQVVIETQNRKIICTAHGTGTEHDFQLFKRSKVKPLTEIEIMADKGYQGIKKIHHNSYTPIKKSKKKSLKTREREYNRELAKHRIYVEHVIRSLKIVRILAQPYRNRRRRFEVEMCQIYFGIQNRLVGLRFNLIAGLYNYGLNLAIA